MAENVVLPGTGESIASDNIAGNQYQRVKVTLGADGVNDGDISSANPMPVSGTFYQATQPVSGPLTDTQLRATAVPVSGTVTANAGTNLNTSALALETGGNLATLVARTPVAGQAAMTASSPVVIASDQTALPVNFSAAATQTYNVAGVIAINTILLTLDLSQYRGASIQCTSMGTAGVVTPEWSNDNATWVGVTLFTPVGASVTTFNAAGLWNLQKQARYLRLRLSTATTAGTTTIATEAYQTVPQAWFATQPISGTITTVSTVTTVATITNANTAFPGIIADVASAALTTTTTTATITPTFGSAYSVSIPVTVVSGTTPTLDITIQESDDSGTNWFNVYDFPRITATGIYRSPVMTLTGNRVRYVQTVAGASASFTRAINRLQSSAPAQPTRQMIDRSIVLTTLNSVTPSLDTRDCGNRNQLVINVGAITTTAPAIQLEGSDDNGATWYAIGTALTAVASSTVQTTVNDINSALVRARVSTAGVGVTAGYVLVKAHD